GSLLPAARYEPARGLPLRQRGHGHEHDGPRRRRRHFRLRRKTHPEVGGPLMFAAVIRKFDWRTLRFTPREMTLMVAAGATWGIMFAAGMMALTFCNNAMICLDDVVATAALSVTLGIFTIGPVVVCARRG